MFQRLKSDVGDSDGRTSLSFALEGGGIGGVFFVTDSAGQKLAFVYFEEESGRRAAAKLLTKDEARQIAAIIAKLPELLRKP